MVRSLVLFIFLLLSSTSVLAQGNGAIRMKKILFSSKGIVFDTLSVLPGTLKVSCGTNELMAKDYIVDYSAARITIFKACSDSVLLIYRVLPYNLSTPVMRRDTAVIYNAAKGDRDRFLLSPSSENGDLFGQTGLTKQGSISRGISFGNRQNLSVNSSLNLRLSGYIAPNLQVLASVTDDNLPIQPEGNTNKLQEFDQVFIQLFNDQFKLTAGDFWISKPEGYFLTYKKRGQGLTGEYTWKQTKTSSIKTQVSGALSKGKFNRQIIQGVEGNQGPYRLRGNENEPYIVILSGTERIYIDGKLLTRGQEFDYTIDYNTSELTFTARNLITKDSRIVAEFQYSDQNYARSLFQFNTTGTNKNYDWWINAYSEQDAKNQPLQQSLSLEQKSLLASIGDDLLLARVTKIDSIGYSENSIMYKLIDSLGYDSVLVVSVNPNNAFYRVNFTQVGANQGDYVLSEFSALGRVYKWVEPINGVPQGDYAPVTVLITPKQQQLFSAGGRYRFLNGLSVMSEVASSKYDLNTFSRKDSFDDQGYALKSKVEYAKQFGNDTIPQWKWVSSADLEMLDPYFKPIEQYRAVEFDRDWNTRSQGYTGNQVYSSLGTAIQHTAYGQISLSGQHYEVGNDFKGTRAQTIINWRQNGWMVTADGSVMTSSALAKNEFIRHKLDVSKSIKKLRLGIKNDQEYNTFHQDQVLQTRSYSFFDVQGYASIGDTVNGQVKFVYRERTDGRSDSTSLKRAALARTIGVEWTKRATAGNGWKNQRLVIIGNVRTLEIKDTSLIKQTPEQTTNGRFDHEIKLFKSAIQLTTFYEVGAGLEQRKEFIYIKVNDGQGVYTWIDYNGDGVKDLNEFEIAAYADQASYIRVFTPSNTYSKTYSNEYNQSLMLKPERLWSNEKGWKKVVSMFSTMSRFRIQRKVSIFDGFDAYNPFVRNIGDASLISTAGNVRQSIYFNRLSSVFGMEYHFNHQTTKTLLASGFDGRNVQSNEINARWNIQKKFSILGSYERGIKTSAVDYTPNRSYYLNYYLIKPSLVYQPSSSFRLSLDGRYSYKLNAISYGGESSLLRDLGITAKINQAKKGSFQAQVNYIQINFNGNANSPLGFELLEALKPGQNTVWTFGYQRTVSKNLQISIQYNGRKSEGNKPVHAGGMEVKAFF